MLQIQALSSNSIVLITDEDGNGGQYAAHGLGFEERVSVRDFASFGVLAVAFAAASLQRRLPCWWRCCPVCRFACLRHNEHLHSSPKQLYQACKSQSSGPTLVYEFGPTYMREQSVTQTDVLKEREPERTTCS
ncbi:hypothetical protein M758_6G048400 [Ceratodon purpureus]|uniref:Uncharacterized protein n=1 Tax=Ceratodon purpureus TaxID=3225 RepID=A0A8T0HAW4_CERPU|nr:hypothetical protein KC19_6G051300 [Ceratodon purpureus]KAG0612736.1 hypothetical protein M758_6G048400 [Ceratodon purpureus]